MIVTISLPFLYATRITYKWSWY